MKKLNQRGVRLSAIALFFAVPASAVPPHQHVQSVAAHLVGQMDTSAQAAANPDAPNVRMTTCRVQLLEERDNLREDVIYLYQEQALSENLAQPYRQRFLEISAASDGKTVESKSFKPTNSERWSGLCNEPKNERIVSSKDLGKSVCTVYLKPLINVYVGTTPSEGCPANFRGAVKITNRIILHESGMDTLDRGFDAQNHQVWGAEDDSYQFRWLDK